MPSRLTGMQFQALRSMGHEPWVVAYRHGHHIEWKCKRFGVREWVSLKDDFLLNKVITAGNDLENMGLAETYEHRCCPGTDCHMNDKLMMRLTPRGQQLLERANAYVQKAKGK